MSEFGIERELERNLNEVAAPEALWDRIEAQRTRPRSRSAVSTLWLVAAALMVMAAGTAAWQLTRAHAQSFGMEAMAREEIQGDVGALDFQSEDPAAIRAWVKDRTDIALDLRSRNSAVRLLGARIVARAGTQAGAPVIAVSYAVGGARAALLVARADSTGDRGHQFARIEPEARGLFSWTGHGQICTLACSAKDPQVACLLCHETTAVN